MSSPMSPISNHATAARIRDNQRRSRARRKEYLEELEARIHKYEKQGVQVAKEIQDAAKAVVEENRKLKAEMAALREQQASSVQSRGVAVEAMAAPVADYARAPIRASRDDCDTRLAVAGINKNYVSQGTQCDFTHDCFSSDGALFTIENENICDEQRATNQSAPSQPTASTTTPALSFPASPPPISMTEAPDLPPSHSSCAFAVAVLTGMRADVSAEDVKADLGCVSDIDRCSISNEKLFGAVDRYT